MLRACVLQKHCAMLLQDNSSRRALNLTRTPYPPSSCSCTHGLNGGAGGCSLGRHDFTSAGTPCESVPKQPPSSRHSKVPAVHESVERGCLPKQRDYMPLLSYRRASPSGGPQVTQHGPAGSELQERVHPRGVPHITNSQRTWASTARGRQLFTSLLAQPVAIVVMPGSNHSGR